MALPQASSPAPRTGCRQVIVIPKSRAEEIRVTLDEFKGQTLVNIRVWFEAEDGEKRPGKQGIA